MKPGPNQYPMRDKLLIALAAGAALLGTFLWLRPGPAEGAGEKQFVIEEPMGAEVGPKCASGCSLKKHPVPPFPEGAFRQAITDLAALPLPTGGKTNAPLDQLLFHGRKTRTYLEHLGAGTLDPKKKALLERELRRAHAEVSFRIVDAAGRVRARVPWTRVPFGEKRHLEPTIRDDIQAMSFNGTLMRTGLGHIWARY